MKQTIRRISFHSIHLSLALLIIATTALTAEAAKVKPLSTDQTVEELQESVAYILSLSEEELRNRVPTQSHGVWHTDCPNCNAGSDDRGPFEWTPEDPERLQCGNCGAVYPNNPNFPDNRRVQVRTSDGIHRLDYWENLEGYRHFFRAHADYLHRTYLENRIRDLALLYDATGEDRYARPAAILLHRFAEVVPNYAFVVDLPYQQKQFLPPRDDRVAGSQLFRSSVWSRWTEDDIPGRLISAYDTLYEWEGWETVAEGDVRKTIENDLVRYLTEYLLTFEEPYLFESPRIWKDVIHAGRLLDEPVWVHEGVRRFEEMFVRRFLYDGFWNETSPSAHAAILEELAEVREIADGYSDPGNYTSSTGRTFKDLDLAREIPFYQLALDALESSRLPDGRLLPVNRTWAVSENAAAEKKGPRASSESVLLPGFGVAILAGGEDNQQIFSWLNFTAGTENKHRDALSIGLFGHGREILPDIGATNTRYRRAWTDSTMSHSTVVVDGREQALDENHSGQRLVSFATDGSRFRLAAAESDSAYPDRTERYRRTLMLIGNQAEDAYLLDVFEIQGGNRHDWVLHGNANADSTLEIRGVSFRPFRGTLVNPGVNFQMPQTSEDDMGTEGAFSFIRDLQVGASQEPLRIDLRLTDFSDQGSRTLFAPVPDAELFTGRSPSIRPANEQNSQLDTHTHPTFVARRRGNDLDSVFVAAHEAVSGFPRLHDIQTRRSDGRLWVSVRHAGGRDYISIALGEPTSGTFGTSKGDFTTDAAWAAVRLDRNDVVISAHIVDGDQLQFRNYRLQGPGRFNGEVREVRGGGAGSTSFDLAERFPPQNSQAFIVEFPDGSSRAYSVERVEIHPGGTRVYVRESAGFTVSDGQILFPHPERTINGTELTYRLITSAHSE